MTTKRVSLAGLPPLSRSRNAFQSLARSIIYQQITGKAADTILKRFLAEFSGRSFPTPEAVAALPSARFRAAGVSMQKESYLRDLAAKFLDKTIQPARFAKMTDEEVKAHVVRVKGIGPWTGDMFLIFALGRPDVLPTGDLGVQKGFQKAFGLKRLPTPSEMEKLALPYAGKRSLLARALWRIADEGKV